LPALRQLCVPGAGAIDALVVLTLDIIRTSMSRAGSIPASARRRESSVPAHRAFDPTRSANRLTDARVPRIACSTWCEVRTNWPTCMRANVLKRATIRFTTKPLHHARHIAKLHRARMVRPDGTAALVHASAGLVFFVPSIT